MKILLVTNHLNIGGITSYLLTLSAGLMRRGHTVYLASSGGRMLSRFVELGAVTVGIPLRTKNEFSPRVAVSAALLAAGFDRAKIDLIHAQTRSSQVLGCLCARWRGVPLVSTCHGFFNHRRLSRRLFPCWGRRVIAISDAVSDHLRQDFGVPAERITVIPNGIDVRGIMSRQSPSGRHAARASLGAGQGPLLVHIGRLSDVKGQLYLIRAMPAVLKEFPQARLVIAGEGRMQAALEAEIGRLGLHARVSLRREIKDTGELLDAADIFVMPSLAEGLGLSLMEAMACGCAVIGSNVGGIVSLIKDGETGILVRPADPEAIAQAVIRLASDSALRSRLGDAARRSISEGFSQDAMVEKTLEVYSACLG